MVGKDRTSPAANIAHGELALMLCEAMLHVLVERGVLRKSDALEALDSVSAVAAEWRPAAALDRTGPIETMRASFAAK